MLDLNAGVLKSLGRKCHAKNTWVNAHGSVCVCAIACASDDFLDVFDCSTGCTLQLQYQISACARADRHLGTFANIANAIQCYSVLVIHLKLNVHLPCFIVCTYVTPTQLNICIERATIFSCLDMLVLHTVCLHTQPNLLQNNININKNSNINIYIYMYPASRLFTCGTR